ncbi:unnamed protein product [Symbiodinium sp. CCMP2592]|nr:unnamed protein product [Symbiodinium sp. CCMP2592]
MSLYSINASLVSFNSAISACARSGHWQGAVALLDRITESRLVPDMFSLSSAVGACSKGHNWETALQLVAAFRGARLPVDITALGSVGAVCEEPRKLREILEDVQQLAAWQLSFSQT